MDPRTLARFSFLIPFWALSISFLRVARRPPTAIGITSATAWSIGTQFARRFW